MEKKIQNNFEEVITTDKDIDIGLEKNAKELEEEIDDIIISSVTLENEDEVDDVKKNSNTMEVDPPESHSADTDPLSEAIEEICRLQKSLDAAKEEILKLKEKMSDLSEASFLNDDHKTKFFTGLHNSKVLFLLHDLVSPYLHKRTNIALPTFQQLILTLMKLCLNLPLEYLAYRFGVATSTISRYFRRCLHVVYCMLKSLIHWPARETLHATMPQCFKDSFGNKVTVIIDCFEVFIEKPSSLYSSAQCWSQYKHHTTVKLLIGITPQGSISCISEAYGGRTSDKFITQDSGFVDYLIPDDVTFADRGFLIEDIVKQVGAEVKIPCFTEGKTQLHPSELEETRSIAHVRIHVERVIGSVRQKYTILSGIMPISMLRPSENGISIFDEIVLVCCALVNLCPSMVSLLN